MPTYLSWAGYLLTNQMLMTKYCMKNLNRPGSGRELISKVLASTGTKDKTLIKQQEALSSIMQALPKGNSTPRSKFADR